MIKSLRQLILEARNLKLSNHEKSLIVRDVLFGRQHWGRSIWVVLTNQFNLKFKPMPILIAILIALGGGVSFAAEKALPGDALYPVKVNVTEQVRGFATLDARAKVEWEATLAERRLKEAEDLAAEGKLDSETRARLEANFKAHADRVQLRIENFED